MGTPWSMKRPSSRIPKWLLVLIAVLVPGGVLIALLLHWMSDRDDKEKDDGDTKPQRR
jgi:hypothetical protein